MSMDHEMKSKLDWYAQHTLHTHYLRYDDFKGKSFLKYKYKDERKEYEGKFDSELNILRNTIAT